MKPNRELLLPGYLTSGISSVVAPSVEAAGSSYSET